MFIQFDKNDLDVSVFTIGKEYKLISTIDGIETTIPRAFVKAINNEANEVEFEPLVEKQKIEVQNFNDDQFKSIEFFNKETNEMVLKIK